MSNKSLEEALSRLASTDNSELKTACNRVLVSTFSYYSASYVFGVVYNSVFKFRLF